ncbi:MAG: hypothetical protein KF712_01135 [Akkermansiaceae bacterium]|nr:hypothetical protein [Akkermansiaceae bacterium]
MNHLSPITHPRRAGGFLRKLAAVSISSVALFSGLLTAAESAGKLRIAILAGEKHSDEFSAALKESGMKAEKYPDSSQGWSKLKADLKNLDVIVGAPDLNAILPRADGGKAEAEELRGFMEAGGAIVLTGATGPGQLEWLSLLDEKLAVTTEEPKQKPKDGTLSEMNPVHSFRILPGRLGDTGEISTFYKAGTPGEWEHIARWASQPCMMMKRFGKGFVVLSALRHPDAGLLGNTGTMLRLQRMGLFHRMSEHDFGGAKDTFGRKVIAPGRGQTRLMLRNTTDEPLDVSAVLRMDNGKETRTVRRGVKGIKANDQSWLALPVMADLRGETKVGVSIINPSDGAEIPLLAETITLPEFLTVIPPAYRGMISTARRDKDVHFKIRLEPIYGNIAGMPLKLEITAPDGKRISAKEMTVTTAEFPVVMDLPADAPEGEYTIRAVTERPGAVVDEAKAVFKIVPVRPGQVFVDQDTVILKDGKPFFPLGIYHVSGAQVDEAAEIGFNMFQFWDWDATPENMDRLAEKGITSIWEGQAWGTAVYLNPATASTHPAFQKQLGLMEEAVAKYKNHPALSMWYVADEPSPYHLPSLRAINGKWHELDEDHPTYLVATGEYGQLQDACDILAIDVYLVYRGQRNHLSAIASATDAALKGVDFRKPVIAVPQSFGNNKLHNEKPEEVRCISYLHLTHGVRGMMWYCWKETGDKTGEEGAGHHPETQKVLKDLVAEIKVVAPALMEPGGRMLRSADGRIHALLCGSAATGRYLLFVNEDYEATDAVLRLPELTGGKLTGLFGTAAAEVKDGNVKLKVSALGTGVFRID